MLQNFKRKKKGVREQKRKKTLMLLLIPFLVQERRKYLWSGITHSTLLQGCWQQQKESWQAHSIGEKFQCISVLSIDQRSGLILASFFLCLSLSLSLFFFFF